MPTVVAEGCLCVSMFCLCRCPCSERFLFRVTHHMAFLRLVSFMSTVFPRSLQGVGGYVQYEGIRGPFPLPGMEFWRVTALLNLWVLR